jgi:nitrite reductase/ring-hydroxylating ferredoxin subunit
MKYPLINISEIPDEGSTLVDFFGRQVHVYKVDGKPRAVANVCMHFGGPLEFKDCKLVCPWHNTEYDSADGHRLSGPAPSNYKLMFLSTIVENDMLTYVWGE